MRFRFLVAILALLVTSVRAEEHATARLVTAYDLDSTSFIYCVSTGTNGSAWGGDIPGSSPIKTSGSSTTVTEVTTDSLPFALLNVGDVILTTNSVGAKVVRYITAKASGASITVNSAVDLGTSIPFSWRKVSCGTAATDGWVDVAGWPRKKISGHLNQMNATSIDFKWECRDNNWETNVVNVYPGTVTVTGTCPGGTAASNACNYTAAGENTRTDLVIEVPYDACRLGMKVNTDDGGDTGANAESITAFITVERSR